MPKRIYVGKDVDETARKTGIPVDTLRKAELGQIELSRAQLEKLQKTLSRDARRPRQELDDYP